MPRSGSTGCDWMRRSDAGARSIERRHHMEFLTQLWLPILVSAVATWIAGAVFWMALPHHKKDMKELPNQRDVIEKIRGLGLAPGNYVFPGGRVRQGGDEGP